MGAIVSRLEDQLRLYRELPLGRKHSTRRSLFVECVEAGMTRRRIADIVGEPGSKVGKIVRDEQERRNPRLRHEREARQVCLPDDLRADIFRSFELDPNSAPLFTEAEEAIVNAVVSKLLVLLQQAADDLLLGLDLHASRSSA